MNHFKGNQLFKKDGSSHSADSVLAGKSIVMIYFSAHWCPPCKAFTPKLKQFYDQVKGEGVEIIFVSSDESHNAMLSYMKESHGDWFAVEHESDLDKKLSEEFDVSGIPYLVVLKADGTVITTEGRSAVMKQGAAAVKDWKK